MENQLASIVFSSVILSLTVLEKKRLMNLITPFTIAAWPFVVIILFNNFILVNFEYYFITARAQLFIMINLIIIWLIGFLLSFYLIDKYDIKQKNNFTSAFKHISNYQFLIIVISWIVIFMNFYRANSLVSHYGGYWFLADDKFEKIMGRGFVAHMVQVGKVCFLLLVFTFNYAKSKSLYIITLFSLFFAIALIQVKYHLLFLIIITFLFYNIRKSLKEQIKGILRISIILFLVMNMFWVFLTIIWGSFSFENNVVWDFFLKQFLTYFVSGPIALDKWLTLGDIKPDWTLFTVLLNIKNFIYGNPSIINPIPLVSHGFMHSSPDTIGNVGTSFGVYYFIGGYSFTLLVSTILAIVTYSLYYICFNTKNTILIYLNLLFLTLGLLNFFVQFFTLLSLYEMFAIFVFFILIFKTSSYINKLINLNDSNKLIND